MSLSYLSFLTVRDIYRHLPKLVLGAMNSAAASRAAGRFTRFPLPNPMDAAKFTAVVGLAHIIYTRISSDSYGLPDEKQSSRMRNSSKFIIAALAMYGVHMIANPEKTLLSFAKSSALAAASLLLADKSVELLD